MANMAVSRIKREFKEVIKSEEVSKYVWLKWASAKSDIKYVINMAYCSPSRFDGKEKISTFLEQSFENKNNRKRYV